MQAVATPMHEVTKRNAPAGDAIAACNVTHSYLLDTTAMYRTASALASTAQAPNQKRRAADILSMMITIGQTAL